ncbi:NAD(P)/FAD-dependent oxidoreductase [Paradevosia shaoguanensis]|uniref:NADH:ubiquinone reductase (non-electrogenic) n=1 Tax=Paradevosia shaoguanensis TaxID=1335043 RepID=A0AA41QKH0_9HYPH|nr:NAD(P)/FAD-dependent oxidoreductase [Paradevosia shaoguanensis]MCF1741791.1 NAD(P)/FAD-dependent oxidoreductase [Paradevosia shaoguanensis]MCI0126274.1 NAD(P)/FAD-dependent oxidoreductase [Paradevosia shaoguanensis]CDP50081.1 NADH dehydrogenase [Devosia sp. DBB001]
MTGNAKHRVVIVGGGFGGLMAAQKLAGSGLDITLVDRRNHHLFQPLLYQVATAALATSDIAWPIRSLVRGKEDIKTLLGSVTGVDKEAREVLLEDGARIPYDSLILATGARHAYFGHDEWEPNAPGLKTLEDATAIRRRLLLAFEQAEREPDEARRKALLTFVIIGAGPTGVELAGTITELAEASMRGDFRNIRPEDARVVLIEAADRVLLNFVPELSAYALDALRKLGVEVELGRAVTEIDREGVVYGGQRLAARTVIWAAGVQASPAAKWLDVEADRAGRVKVQADLTVPGYPEIFVVGDTALALRPDGRPVPGVGDAAKQGGKHAAATIKARLAGTKPPTFAYKHAGDLATIGKRAAVIDFGWLKLKGFPAWWVWGVAHIYFLIGVKNRLFVSITWLLQLLSGRRSARLITQGDASGRWEHRP